MRKQQNPYEIRLLVLALGERFPMLVERATGVPLYKSTLYALTRLRTTPVQRSISTAWPS